MGRPATGWSTLGIREFIRTPLPAASTTTVTPPRVSGERARLDPADAFTRMGGIAADYSGRLRGPDALKRPGRRCRAAALPWPSRARCAPAAQGPADAAGGRAYSRSAARHL